ncbi:MAG: phosphoglycerate kinase [Paracoccaceae bacterium]|nr:phosphoglycerate kinase [Paracoccaceae bacterium]
MTWQTLDDLQIRGRRVLTRVDINVPIDQGRVADSTRIQRVAPTIRRILERGGRPILMSHLGRPGGRIVPDLSLVAVVDTLSDAVNHPVTFVQELPGRAAAPAVDGMGEDTILLLENLRFMPGEEKNDPNFAAELAALGDCFCNDAFSTAHRAHASTVGVPRFVPSCAGLLMQTELAALEIALTAPERPLVAVVGGAKISSKLDLLDALVRKTDAMIIGGGMANTFLAAQGVNVGRSLYEPDLGKTALAILALAGAEGCTVLLPSDVVVASEPREGVASRTVRAGQSVPGEMILDYGSDSLNQARRVIGQARTVVWNGPLGVFEIPPFDHATIALARFAAKRTMAGDLFSVAGGGDTVAALNAAQVAESFSYLSTAGGAFLQWLEGRTLPAVQALKTQPAKG